jgi:hypothetical protein
VKYRSSDEVEEAQKESVAVYEAAVKIAAILEEVEVAWGQLAAQEALDIVTGGVE